MLNRFRWYRKFRGGLWVYAGWIGRGDRNNLPWSWNKVDRTTVNVGFNIVGKIEMYGFVSQVDTQNIISMIGMMKGSTVSVGELSDGYHTFDELYEHRNVLFCNYISRMKTSRDVWKSKRNADGSTWDGWFVAGISDIITYHMPLSMWDMCDVPEISVGKWNKHTAADALWNLKHIQYLALNGPVENHKGWAPKPHKLESKTPYSSKAYAEYEWSDPPKINVPLVRTIPLPKGTLFQVEAENDGPIFKIISDESDYDGSYDIELIKVGLSWQELGLKTRWMPHDKKGYLLSNIKIIDHVYTSSSDSPV